MASIYVKLSAMKKTGKQVDNIITCKPTALHEAICSRAPMENKTWAPDLPYLWLILNSNASSASRVHARCSDSNEC